jgi:hypothetical protein
MKAYTNAELVEKIQSAEAYVRRTCNGNSSAVRMKKFAIEQKINGLKAQLNSQ